LNNLPKAARVDIRANLSEYLHDRRATERYASFDYCFNYFQEQSDRGLTAELTSQENLEMSCLQLGFYLASWGMYRGSTTRLKRSLAYLKPPVEVIANAPAEIWSTDADSYTPERIELMLDVAAHLRECFPEGASDTTVTKVMLGVFGCVPAFDQYFKRGFGVYGFNASALARIGDFYRENSAVIDAYRVPTLEFATGLETARGYSRAKVIDMIFFVAGAPQPAS